MKTAPEAQGTPPAETEIRQIETGASFESWRGLGTLHVAWTRRGVVRFSVAGQGQGDFAAIIIRRWEATLAALGKLTILADFGRMPTYESRLRIELTGWAVSHRASIEAVHLLSESKLVNMGATLANIALGGIIEIYADRHTFELAAQRAGLTRTLGHLAPGP